MVSILRKSVSWALIASLIFSPLEAASLNRAVYTPGHSVANPAVTFQALTARAANFIRPGFDNQRLRVTVVESSFDIDVAETSWVSINTPTEWQLTAVGPLREFFKRFALPALVIPAAVLLLIHGVGLSDGLGLVVGNIAGIVLFSKNLPQQTAAHTLAISRTQKQWVSYGLSTLFILALGSFDATVLTNSVSHSPIAIVLIMAVAIGSTIHLLTHIANNALASVGVVPAHLFEFPRPRDELDTSHNALPFRFVDRMDPIKRVWKALRGSGSWVGHGQFSFHSFRFTARSETGTTQKIQTAVAVSQTLYQQAFEKIEALDNNPAANHLMARLNKERDSLQKLNVEWIDEGARAGEYISQPNPGSPATLQLNVALATKLNLRLNGRRIEGRNTADVQAAETLAMLQIVYATARHLGDDHKEALHLVLDFYDGMSREEEGRTSQRALQTALRSNSMDSENLFAQFLRQGTDEEAVARRTGESLQTLQLLDSFSLDTWKGLSFEAVQDVRDGVDAALDRLLKIRRGETHAVKALNDLLKISELEPIRPFLTECRDAVQNGNGEVYLKALQTFLDTRFRWRDQQVVTATGQSMIDLPWSRDDIQTIRSRPSDDEDAVRAEIKDVLDRNDKELDAENLKRLAGLARERGIPFFVVRIGRAGHNQGLYAASSRVIDIDANMVRETKRLEKQLLEVAGVYEDDLKTAYQELFSIVYRGRPIPSPHLQGRIEALREKLAEIELKAGKQIRENPRSSILSQNSRHRRNRRQTQNLIKADVREQLDQIGKTLENLVAAIEEAPQTPNSIVVYSFRASETSGHLGAKIMDGEDPYPGKEQILKDLKHDGGQFTFATTSNDVFRYATDILEAPPLYIQEEIEEIKNTEGITIEVKKKVDIKEKELVVLLRNVGPQLAANIQDSLDGNYVSMAREEIIRHTPALRARLSRLEAEHRRQKLDWDDETREAAIRHIIQTKQLDNLVADVATVIEEAFRRNAMDVKKYDEDHEEDHARFMGSLRAVLVAEDSPIQSFYHQMLDACGHDLTHLRSTAEAHTTGQTARLQKTHERLKAAAYLRNRALPHLDEMPNYMMMTTMGPGLTEAVLWHTLNEEINLQNIITDKGLEAKVTKRKNDYQTRLHRIGRSVIQEAGKWADVESKMAGGLSEANAVRSVVDTYKEIYDTVSTLATLIDWEETTQDRAYEPTATEDPDIVKDVLTAHFTWAGRTAVLDNNIAWLREYLAGNSPTTDLLNDALKKVVQRNFASEDDLRAALGKKTYGNVSEDAALRRFISEDATLLSDLRWQLLAVARQTALEQLDAAFAEYIEEDPSAPRYSPKETAESYIHEHRSLANTLAKREVIAEHATAEDRANPYYVYDFFTLAHTSSRVNLGQNEHKSVNVWSQWGGVRNRRGIARVERILQGMNQNIKVELGLKIDEMFKMGDNSGRNVHASTPTAFALIIEAIRRGDIEDLITELNARGEDLLPPAGAGYGGYCIPKDLFYLKLAVALDNRQLLTKLGFPANVQPAIVDFMRRIHGERYRFEYETEWIAFCDRELARDPILGPHFQIHGTQMIVQSADIARSLAEQGHLNLYDDAERFMKHLVANYATDKIIVNSEEFQRFMVFFSSWAWLRKNAPHLNKKVVSMMINYKGSTVDDLSEDVRYSVALRMFEIMMGEYEHLTHSLDDNGKTLVRLMVEGFDPDDLSKELDDKDLEAKNKNFLVAAWNMLGIKKPTPAQIESFKEIFPHLGTPADIRLYSPLHTLTNTGATVKDTFGYYTGNKIEETGKQVINELTDTHGRFKLSVAVLQANAKSYGGDLSRWKLPTWWWEKEENRKQWQDYCEKVGGRIHAAVHILRGIDRSLEHSLTGIDSFHISAPYPAIWDVLHHPSKLKFLMQLGRPGSDLHIFDMPVGRRVRAMGKYDVMRWLAKGGTYQTIGIGEETVDEWRKQMEQQKRRTLHLVRLLQEKRYDEAEAYYEKMQDWALKDNKTVRKEMDKLQRFGVASARLRGAVPLALQDALFYVETKRLPLETLQGERLKAVIAALGGMYELDGKSQTEVNEFFGDLEKALAGYRSFKGGRRRPSKLVRENFSNEKAKAIFETLVQTEYIPADRAPEIAQREVSSVKAAEERGATESLKSRAEDEKKAREFAIQQARKAEFQSAAQQDFDTLQSCLDAAAQVRSRILQIVRESDSRPAPEILAKLQGQLMGLTQQAVRLAARERTTRRFKNEDGVLAYEKLDEALKNLTDSSGAILSHGWHAFYGEELQPGVLSELIDTYVKPGRDGANLKAWLPVIDLLESCYALSAVLDFAGEDPAHVSPEKYAKARAGFMGSTVNDHFHDHLPWFFQRSRAFMNFFESDVRRIPSKKRLMKRICEVQDLIFSNKGRVVAFDWAAESHAWLHDFFAPLDERYSYLKNFDEATRHGIAGDVDMTTGQGDIGVQAKGESLEQTRWLAYLQQASAIRMQAVGFPVKDYFDDFDPDIIGAREKVNMFYAFAPERPHVQGWVEEAQAVNEQLLAHGEPGMNLIIGRDGDWIKKDYAGNSGKESDLFGITEGFVYLTRDQYAKALQQRAAQKSQTLSLTDAYAQADRVLVQQRDKDHKVKPYIYVAVRFKQETHTAPVACIPVAFHGYRRFVNGELEDHGLPQIHGSRLQIADSYNKWITAIESEEDIRQPDQIVWKMSYNPLLEAHFKEQGVSEEKIPGKIQQIILDGPNAKDADAREAYEIIRPLMQGPKDKEFIGIRLFAQTYLDVTLATAEPGARFLTKPAGASGSRGMELFYVAKPTGDGSVEVNEAVLNDLAGKMYAIGMKDDILLASVWSLQPEFYMSEAFMGQFEHEQIATKNRPLERGLNRLFSTYRLMASTPNPEAPDDTKGKWFFHHPILTSASNSDKNVGYITNEATGGTFFMLKPEHIKTGEWAAVMRAMQAGVKKIMEGTPRRAQRMAREFNAEIGQSLTGETYDQPMWKMVDLWVMPILSVQGRYIRSETVTLPDGTKTMKVFVARKNARGQEDEVEAHVEGYYAALIEVNDGIGQVLQVRRFEAKEFDKLTAAQKEEVGHWPVGANDRIPMMNFSRLLQRYYQRNVRTDYFPITQPQATVATRTESTSASLAQLAVAATPLDGSRRLDSRDLGVVIKNYLLEAMRLQPHAVQNAKTAIDPDHTNAPSVRQALMNHMQSLLINIDNDLLSTRTSWADALQLHQEIDAWINNGDNVRTTMRVVLEELADRPRPSAPLRTISRRLTQQELRKRLNGRPVHAVVYNTSVGMDSELMWWMQEAERSNHDRPSYAIIAVHADQVQQDGTVRRAMFWDAEEQAWYEVSFDSADPLLPNRVQILALHPSDERAAHAELSKRFKRAERKGLVVLNPAEAAETLDSKFKTSRALEQAGIAVPRYSLIHQKALAHVVRERFDAAVTHLRNGELGRRTVAVFIQPDHGTEGAQVERFELTVEVTLTGRPRLIQNEAFQAAVRHIRAIQETDDVLVRESWDGNTDVRLYAFAAGDGHESQVYGFGQQAVVGMNTNPARGGVRTPLNTALETMGVPQTEPELHALANTVRQTLGQSAVSIDVRWREEREIGTGGKVLRHVPGVLDVHSRIIGAPEATPLLPSDNVSKDFFADPQQTETAFLWKELIIGAVPVLLLMIFNFWLGFGLLVGVAAVHKVGHQSMAVRYTNDLVGYRWNQFGLFEKTLENLSVRQRAIFDAAGPLANIAASLLSFAVLIFHGDFSWGLIAFATSNLLLGVLTFRREGMKFIPIVVEPWVQEFIATHQQTMRRQSDQPRTAVLSGA